MAAMITLVVMRHHRYDRQGDSTKLLNKSGRTASQDIGRQLATNGAFPELALTSTAVRAVETAIEVMRGAESEEPLLRTSDSLHYLFADPRQAVETVGECLRKCLETGTECVLIVSHGAKTNFVQSIMGHFAGTKPEFDDGDTYVIPLDDNLQLAGEVIGPIRGNA